MIPYTRSLSTEKIYYHREYKNDFSAASTDKIKKIFYKIIIASLPILALNLSLKSTISLITGFSRSYTHINLLSQQIVENKLICYPLLSTAISVLSLACSIIELPTGMIITTSHDIIVEIFNLLEHIENKNEMKILGSFLSLMNNGCHLCLLIHATGTLLTVGLCIQVGSELYKIVQNALSEDYIEASSHTVLGAARGSQLYTNTHIHH